MTSLDSIVLPLAGSRALVEVALKALEVSK